MQWQLTPYILVLFVAGVTSFLWSLYGLKAIRNQGRIPHVLAFIVLGFTVTVWSTGYAFQLASTTLEAKLFAYKIMHIGAVMAPPAWFAFAIAYTGRSEWLTPTTTVGLIAIPAALLVTLPANPHSLALTHATIETHGSLRLLVTGNGPLYLLHLAYAYVTIMIGAWFIIKYAVQSATIIRRQSVLLILGVTIPLLLNVFNVLTVPPLGGSLSVNLTPVSLALSTVLLGVAIFRYQMLDLMPIASEVVLAQMDDCVIVLDDRYRIADLNRSAETLLGDCDTVVGTRITRHLPEYPSPERDSPLLVTLQATDGKERLLQLTRSPIRKHGKQYGWVVLAHDVTTLERQRRDLAKQNDRLDAFTRVVAHDLQSPLGVIDGYTGLAERTGEKQHFDTIRDTVSEMFTFVEDLLLLSQQGDIVEDLHPVSLVTIVEDVERGMVDTHLEVVLETDVVVLADRDRLRQVVDNLFRNAIDHGDDTATVTVGELHDGFFVEDDGPGISADMREDVFELGVSTQRSGSGFGLAIVRDIVDAHGWTIRVSEGTTGGARFEITGVDLDTAA